MCCTCLQLDGIESLDQGKEGRDQHMLCSDLVLFGFLDVNNLHASDDAGRVRGAKG